MEQIDNIRTVLDAARSAEISSINLDELEQGQLPVLFVPEGYTATVLKDLEKHLPTPIRKIAVVSLSDADSFIAYTKEHGNSIHSHIYLQADYPQGRVEFTAIINDHGGDYDAQAWRDHRATFNPDKSLEWQRWTKNNCTPMSQIEFASWIEDNMADIATVDKLPNASQMLEMALSFEANSEKRFKSATRLQSGGISMEYIDTEDDATRQRMEMFDRFAIGIPVFAQPITVGGQGTDAPAVGYRIDARLKYRIREGKLALWYELVRADKVLAAASQDLVVKIRDEAGFPLLAGNPFSNN